MATLPQPRTWSKNAPSVSDILRPSLLTTVASSSHRVRPHLRCYRQKQTSGLARLQNIKQNLTATLRTSLSHSLHLQRRTVTSQPRCSGTSVSARPDVFPSLSLSYLHGKWHHFLSQVHLPYVATRILADRHLLFTTRCMFRLFVKAIRLRHYKYVKIQNAALCHISENTW